MAIRVLLDHGVPEDHIIFVTFLVAKHGGVVALRKAFPLVKIVCSAVDDQITERWLECIGEEGEGLQDPTLQVPDNFQQKEGRKVWVVEPGMGHIGAVLCVFIKSDIASSYTDLQVTDIICDNSTGQMSFHDATKR